MINFVFNLYIDFFNLHHFYFYSSLAYGRITDNKLRHYYKPTKNYFVCVFLDRCYLITNWQ